MDRQQLRLVLVLTLICIVAGGVLAWVNGLTEPRIKQQAEFNAANALQETLPEAVDFRAERVLLKRVQETVGPEITGLSLGYDDQNNNVGLVMTVESQGYAGLLQLMVGLSLQGEVTGVKVLNHSETVGLGAKVSEEDFLQQKAFTEASTADTLAVNKDNGEVQAVTGATISSRAVVRCVNQALAAARVVLND